MENEGERRDWLYTYTLSQYEKECKQTVGLITNYVEWMAKQHEWADRSHRLWQFNLWDSHRVEGTGQQQTDRTDGGKRREKKQRGGEIYLKKKTNSF